MPHLHNEAELRKYSPLQLHDSCSVLYLPILFPSLLSIYQPTNLSNNLFTNYHPPLYLFNLNPPHLHLTPSFYFSVICVIFFNYLTSSSSFSSPIGPLKAILKLPRILGAEQDCPCTCSTRSGRAYRKWPASIFQHSNLQYVRKRNQWWYVHTFLRTTMCNESNPLYTRLFYILYLI